MKMPGEVKVISSIDDKPLAPLSVWATDAWN